MANIDWSKAPEGATHAFIRIVDNHVYFWLKDSPSGGLEVFEQGAWVNTMYSSILQYEKHMAGLFYSKIVSLPLEPKPIDWDNCPSLATHWDTLRQWQNPDVYHRDSAEDAIAYAGLKAESLESGN